MSTRRGCIAFQLQIWFLADRPLEEGPACSLQSTSAIKVLDGSATNWENHFFMDPAVCMGPCWNRKGPSPDCCHIFQSTQQSKISLYTVALRGLGQTMKISPTPTVQQRTWTSVFTYFWPCSMFSRIGPFWVKAPHLREVFRCRRHKQQATTSVAILSKSTYSTRALLLEQMFMAW